MSKIENTVSNIFVNKMASSMWKILSKDEVIEYWLRSGWSKNRISYAMSILLGRGIVVKISSGIYIVKGPTESIDAWKIYWSLIKKIIAVHAPGWGVVGGEKAIELHLQNYSIPEVLILYTRDTSLRIKLTDGREVHFRTLVSGPKTSKKNLWRTIVDHAITLDTPEKIQVCGYELALLESLSLRRHDMGIEEANIVRFLRSFAPQLHRDVLGNLTRLRYIRPLNRLRVLARDLGYTSLYAMTLEIIRDEGGGCYLNL